MNFEGRLKHTPPISPNRACPRAYDLDDPHPPDDDELDPSAWQLARRTYHKMVVAENLFFLGYLHFSSNAKTLAAVNSFRRSAHELCLAGCIPRLPVDLGATTLHLDPWLNTSPHDMPLPPRGHRVTAVRLHLDVRSHYGKHRDCRGG